MERGARALLAAGERRARGEPRHPRAAPSTALLSCSLEEPVGARAPPRRQRGTGRRAREGAGRRRSREVGGECPAGGWSIPAGRERGDRGWDGMRSRDGGCSAPSKRGQRAGSQGWPGSPESRDLPGKAQYFSKTVSSAPREPGLAGQSRILVTAAKDSAGTPP